MALKIKALASYGMITRFPQLDVPKLNLEFERIYDTYRKLGNQLTILKKHIPAIFRHAFPTPSSNVCYLHFPRIAKKRKHMKKSMRKL